MAAQTPAIDQAEQARGELWFQALLDTSVKTIDPWVNSSGFAFNYSTHRNWTFTSKSRFGETFLLNTRLQRHDRETAGSVAGYFTDASMTLVSMNGIESINALKEIELPPGQEPSLRLSHCLAKRRSRRTYTGDPMELRTLASMVRAGAGVTGHGKAKLRNQHLETVTIPFRAAPSPGGLYSIDLYLAVQNVRGIEGGLYAFSPRRDKLLLLKAQSSGVLEQIRQSCSYPDQLIAHSRASVIFLLVARPWKVMRKYGDRGVRYIFIEAGEITQNIHLTATALGYGTVESASFFDDEMNHAIGLDGGTATVVHMVYAGLAAESI